MAMPKKLTAKQQKLIAFLRDNPCVSTRVMGEFMGVGQSTVYAMIKKLVRRGIVHHTYGCEEDWRIL